MNWAIVVPVGIGIAVLAAMVFAAADISGAISRQEELDEVKFYFAKGFAQTTPSSHIPPYQDVSKMLYNREPFCTGCSEHGRCIQARMRYIHGLKHSKYPWICLKKEELK